MSDKRLAKPKPKAEDHTQQHTLTHTEGETRRQVRSVWQTDAASRIERTKDTANGLKLARAKQLWKSGGGRGGVHGMQMPKCACVLLLRKRRALHASN